MSTVSQMCTLCSHRRSWCYWARKCVKLIQWYKLVALDCLSECQSWPFFLRRNLESHMSDRLLARHLARLRKEAYHLVLELTITHADSNLSKRIDGLIPNCRYHYCALCCFFPRLSSFVFRDKHPFGEPTKSSALPFWWLPSRSAPNFLSFISLWFQFKWFLLVYLLLRFFWPDQSSESCKISFGFALPGL